MKTASGSSSKTLLGIPNMSGALVANDIRAGLGEGPFWHGGAIHWVDIVGKKLYRERSGGLVEAREFSEMIGAAAPRASGGFVLAMKDGFSFISDFYREAVPIGDPESGMPDNRFNDGKCDPAGRFWAGTMDLNASPGAGSLYLLDRDLSIQKKFGPVTISNGLAWSLDRRSMYYIDTPTHRVLEFDYGDATGNIRDPRPLLEIDPKDGNPDGMTIDERGRLWIALWGGGAVVCFDPEAKAFVEKIELPVSQPSSCAFGGENLDELYVTSARIDLAPERLAEEPLAGALFKINVGTRGLPVNCFAG